MKKKDRIAELKEWSTKQNDSEHKKALVEALENLLSFSDEELKKQIENEKQPILINGLALELLKNRKKALLKIEHILHNP
ncbi:MAG: hypothetical protein JXD23_08085 [Spirochaetales bacterium]|nr:hypothetical protein [Spirochaetales bacterium]